MNKYLAHVEWTMKYNGRELSNEVSDILLVSVPFAHLSSTDYDLIVLKYYYNVLPKRDPEKLSLTISADICDENNKFILSTKANIPVNNISKEYDQNSKYDKFVICSGSFNILVPKSEKEN